jgi:3-oxoacid CoA-transferase B subunit
MAGVRLTRDLLAARVAAEFQDGWIVNLGVPTTCSDFIPAEREVILHSENGLIGYGRLATEAEVGPYVVNAGVQPVELKAYASIVHHADAFAIIRRGLIDATVLGAYEVAANGDFANWKTAGRKGGGIGGAMDLAASARRVFVMMDHTTRDNRPRLLPRCTLPLTAPGVVTRVFTDVGVFEPAGDAFRLMEIAPGFTPEEVGALTGAPLIVSDALKGLQV